MTRATRRGEYTGGASGVVYVAFELGRTTRKLGVTTGLEAPPWVRTIPAGDLGRLGRELGEAKRRVGLPSGPPVRSCYQAGRDGFWLYRALTAQGWDARVVDSSNI